MNREWRGFRGVDSSIKPIAEAGSTSLFQNSMPSAHYLRFYRFFVLYYSHLVFPPSLPSYTCLHWLDFMAVT